MTDINARPKISTLALSLGNRLLGEKVKLTLDGDPSGDAGKDLAADLFHDLYQFNPEPKEQVEQSRAINQRLMQWLHGMQTWEGSKVEVAGDMFAAQFAAAGMWWHLQQEEVLQEALKAQEEADKLNDQLQQAQAQQQAASAAGMQQEARQAQQQVEALQQMIQKAIEKGQQSLKGLEQSVALKASAAGAIKKATQEAKEIADGMKGWGAGDEQPSMETAKRYLQLNTDRVKKIARVAGRMHGIAAQERAHMIPKGGVTPAEVVYTQDLTRIFPEEAAMMHPAAPEHIRKLKMYDYIENGLLGWEYQAEAKEKGNFVFVGDRSGSMGDEDMVNMLGCGLGLAKIAKADGREYKIGTFNHWGGGIVQIDSAASWEQHMQWANQQSSGGTDFNAALRHALQEVRNMGVEVGADVVFVTDGIAPIDPQVVQEWQDFRKETGTRLLFVPVNDAALRVNDTLNELADMVLPLSDNWDELTRTAARFME